MGTALAQCRWLFFLEYGSDSTPCLNSLTKEQLTLMQLPYTGRKIEIESKVA